jgi:GAF domain-containing protein
VIPDHARDHRLPADLRAQLTVAASLTVPLFAGDRLEGVLYADWGKPRAFADEDVELAEALAAHAAVALRSARLAAEADEARELAATAFARARALASAVETISREGQDLDAILDALSDEARRLFDADEVVIQLRDRDTGELLRHRTARLVEPGSRLATRRSHEPDAFMLEVYATGRAMIATDFQTDERISPEVRAAQPRARSTMAVPLQAGGETLGSLIALWTRRQTNDPKLIDVAGALGRHAAVAIRTARLLEDAQVARAAEAAALAELEAAFEAAADGVMLYGLDGALLRANRQARELFAAIAGGTVEPADEAPGDAAVWRVDGGQLQGAVFGPALRGERVTEELVLQLPTGGERRVHVVAAPILGPDGAATATIVVARDLTEFHEEVAAAGRLEGAVKTARSVAHQLNNQLQAIAGHGELLVATLSGEHRDMARVVGETAFAMGETLTRLLRIVRFEETNTPAGPALDLDAATARRADAPPR